MIRFMLKRIYQAAGPGDGYRVLVDRLWPRGVARADADLDEWCRDVAPSADLRTWFGHRPERYQEFSRRYREELDASGAASRLADRLSGQPVVTLLVAAKDQEHSHGQVLLEVLSEAARRG